MRKPASWIFFIISRQMTPLVFSRSIRSKIERRIRRKSQSTSRTFRPNSSADDVVIEAADDDAVQRIGAADLVAVHQIGVGRHLRPEQRRARRDRTARRRRCRRSAPWSPSGSRSAARRRSRGSSDGGRRARCGYVRASSSAISRGRVGAAVVDDDDFEVRRQLRRGLDGADHHAGDGAAVVVGREEDAQTRGLRRQGLTCEKASKP